MAPARRMNTQTPRQVIGNVLLGLVSGLLLQWMAGPRVIAPEQYDQLVKLSREDPVLVVELRETLQQRIPTEEDYQRLLKGHAQRKRRLLGPEDLGISPPRQDPETGDLVPLTEAEFGKLQDYLRSRRADDGPETR